MPRKPIGNATETRVLLATRRRCAICYGLNRDTGIKQGQIAHIDQSNQNNNEDNLVFLCLVHHDEYDSKTSQRKNLTAGEIKAFRQELILALGSAMDVKVHFGDVQVPASDPFGGEYIRIDSGHNSASITLTPIPDGYESRPSYAITGFAAWSSHPDPHFGPNIGMLRLIGDVCDGMIDVTEYDPIAKDAYNFSLKFENSGFTIEEANVHGRYGMNVRFDGTYRKA